MKRKNFMKDEKQIKLSSNNPNKDDEQITPTSWYLTWLGKFKQISGDTANSILPKFTFLKIIFSVFLLLLFFTPSWIKNSIKESEMLETFEKTVKIVSGNFQSLKYGGFEIQSNAVNKVAQAKDLGNNINTDKITDENTKKEVEKLVSLIKESDKTFKSEIIKQESPSISNSIGWIYLGRSANKTTLMTNSTNIPDITKIPTDVNFDLNDDVYLREGTNCPQSSGKIITAVEKGKQIKALGAVKFCEIDGSKEYAVWLKVERQ